MSNESDNRIKSRVTIYQVAHQAEVSLATVSRVINNNPNVTEETRKKVMDTIKLLGYKPSALAQSLAKAKSTNVGILLPEEPYVYTSNMLSGMVTVAKSYGFRSSIFVAKKIIADAQNQIEKLITSHVDGALIFDDVLPVEELAVLKKFQVPMVVIGHEIEDPLTASVSLDFKTGVLEAVESYRDRGGKEITFLQGDSEGFMMDDIRDALQERCREWGLTFSTIDCDDSYQRLYVDMRTRFINRPDYESYFIAPRDSLAAAVANAATDLGLKVPDKIEILSVIGTKYSYIARPEISSLNMDMFMVGSIAMRMLTKLMEDPKNLGPRIYSLKADYVVRGTTMDGKRTEE